MLPLDQSLNMDVSSEMTHNVTDAMNVSSVESNDFNGASSFSRSHATMCMDKQHEINNLSPLS